MMICSVMTSFLLVPESVNPASKDREEAENSAPMQEVCIGVTSLVEEWERVERSLIGGLWGPEF